MDEEQNRDRSFIAGTIANALSDAALRAFNFKVPRDKFVELAGAQYDYWEIEFKWAAEQDKDQNGK